MKRIFLTGASGFIGGEVAARLARNGHRVTVLVRNDKPILGNDGHAVPVASRIVGDMREDRFGLSEEAFAELAGDLDLVIHCAATTRFDLPDEEYMATNTAGTRHAIDLARAASTPYLHVSTAYVCGSRNGPILESDPLPDSGFTNGYEASKAAAERIVMESGLHYAIARPSIVVGDSVSGQIRTFGPVYGVIKIIAQGRLKTVPIASGASADFVPVDHVAQGIVDLAEHMDKASGAYHLVSGDAPGLVDAITVMAEYAGLPAPAMVDPAEFDPKTLPMLQRWVYHETLKHYSEYLTRNPRFDDSRFRALTGRSCPPTGNAFLHRLIDYSKQQGLVPEPRKKRRFSEQLAQPAQR